MTPAFATFLPTVSLRPSRHLRASFRPTPLHRQRPCVRPYRATAMSTTGAATAAGSGDGVLIAVRSTDRADSSALRQQHASEHVAWATGPAIDTFFEGPLHATGDADASAPYVGTLHIARAASAEAYTSVRATDPHVVAGLFAEADVRQWVCGMKSDGPLPRNLYMVWCVDKADSLALRKATRPRHLDWWRSAGRAGMVGPFPCEGGACGSLLVCEGESVDEVRAWADTDPYKIEGLFESVHVSAVTKVIEDGKYFPLE